MTPKNLTPKKQFEQDIKRDVKARVREGVKAVLFEEMTEHLDADYRELTPARRGERMSGHYLRNLLIPAGRIERLEILAVDLDVSAVSRKSP